MPILAISCSLNASSRSRLLARCAMRQLESLGAEPDFIDIADLALPQCDGDRVYASGAVRSLAGAIAGASAVLLAFPVYNYDAGASAKNLIELTGSAWNDKVVGIVCASGGIASYMAPMGLVSSLMLDFRCLVLPRFVIATGGSFGGDEIVDDAITSRTGMRAGELLRVSWALAPALAPGRGPGG